MMIYILTRIFFDTILTRIFFDTLKLCELDAIILVIYLCELIN